MKDVCEKLDDLVLRSLELMEEKVVVTIQLEDQLREGHIELAKTRYIRGKENVGILRVPQETSINSLFNLTTTLNTTKLSTTEIPHFDISMKNKDNNADNEIQDPIRWFGLLVPQSLKTAQKRFQDSLYLTTRIANINAELESIPKEIEITKIRKNELINYDAEE